MMPYTVLGVSFLILWNLQVQLIIFVHTDDGGVEALLFAVKRLINIQININIVNPVAKCGEKSYTTVIVWLRCLHVYTALQ